MRYFVPYRLRIAVAGGVLLVESLLALVPVIAVRSFTDQLTRSHPDVTTLAGLALGAGAATILASLLATLAGLSLVTVAQSVALKLRAEVFAHLTMQTVDFHTHTRPGEMTSVLMSDVGGIAEGLSATAPNLLRGVITVAAGLVVMFVVSWPLALVTLAVFPAGMVAFRRISQLVYRSRRAAQEQTGHLTAFVQENLGLSGLMLIRSFGQSALVRERFGASSADLRSRELAVARTTAWLLFGGQVVLVIGPVVIITVGALLVASHDLTLAALLEFGVVVIGLFLPSLHNLTSGAAVLLGSTALWGRTFAVLDQSPGIVDRPGAVSIEARGAITVSGVTFAYPEQPTPALSDVSLSVKPGQLVAVVGPSGAGKTTLVSLIARFIEADEGRVAIDGVDVRDIALDSLSRAIGVSFQDTFLFNSSLRDNLLIGRPDATQAELALAVDAAQLQDVVARLPRGYDTLVGERGFALSGGERQRVAIARLIVKDPPILILDEATSQLDSASEELIQRALESVFEGRTSIVIAHRLSTILAADLIAVLDKGRVVELGTHEDLVAQAGLYARLYNLQFRDRLREESAS